MKKPGTWPRLYRQGEILARLDADIPRSTVIDWCGQAVAALKPLNVLIRRHVFASTACMLMTRRSACSIPRWWVASQGSRRAVKEGRIWVYVRDDRPFSGGDPPTVAYFFSVDRNGVHQREHLSGFGGILQADAYSDFRALHEPDPLSRVARIWQAGCWAHLRRGFHDI